jgi:hypothetical protein
LTSGRIRIGPTAEDYLKDLDRIAEALERIEKKMPRVEYRGNTRRRSDQHIQHCR